jgi:ParB/RepB/Spo0J family partition protein
MEPAPVAAQQPLPAPLPPLVFRPPPIPTPVPTATPLPIQTPLVAPVSALRPLAPVQQPPAAPIAPAPIAQAPVAAAPIPQAPVAQAPVAAPHPYPVPNNPVPMGATMLAVTAIVAANLGTRRGEDIPEPLLADIATRGVRQPITVRRSASNPERYEIICGHRRWRAALRVGLTQIPAIVVTQDDAAAILASLAENLQTGNLSAVDEAQAYLRLLTQCAVDASAVTAAIGRDRKHIVQSMRLLGLPPLVRHLVGSGMLSREHAYLLLDAPNPEALADAILAEHLTVEAARQRLGSAAGAEAKS